MKENPIPLAVGVAIAMAAAAGIGVAVAAAQQVVQNLRVINVVDGGYYIGPGNGEFTFVLPANADTQSGTVKDSQGNWLVEMGGANTPFDAPQGVASYQISWTVNGTQQVATLTTY